MHSPIFEKARATECKQILVFITPDELRKIADYMDEEVKTVNCGDLRPFFRMRMDNLDNEVRLIYRQD